MYIGLHVKFSLFLPDFYKTWTFATDFRKILEYQISFSRSRGVPCGWTDGQTDMTELIVTFRSFANAPKNYKVSWWRKKLGFRHCKTRGGEWPPFFRRGSDTEIGEERNS